MGRGGPVFGTPGGSLAEGAASGWSANAGVARAGRAMEVEIGEMLNRRAREHGVAVFHDLGIPGARGGNIDHAVLGGRRLVVIDSKAWRPGLYATIGGRTWRSPGDVERDGSGRPVKGAKPKLVSPFPHADKDWLERAIPMLARYLEQQGVQGIRVDERAIVAVGSSRPGERIRVGVAKMPGARLMSAAAFSRSMGRLLPSGDPDPAAMAALARLVK